MMKSPLSCIRQSFSSLPQGRPLAHRGTHLDESGLELGEGRQDVEKTSGPSGQPGRRLSRGRGPLPHLQRIGDGPGIRTGSG